MNIQKKKPKIAPVVLKIDFENSQMSKIKVTHTNSLSWLLVYMTYKVIRKILHEGK